MSYTKLHAIFVTSFIDETTEIAHLKATEIFGLQVSNIVKSPINCEFSFFIALDGSKEGLEQSNEGDINRNKFIDWIKQQDLEDGSNLISFFEFILRRI